MMTKQNLTKISEGDPEQRFGDAGWGEVIRQLVNRSDQIEGELRSFIKPDERPETGFVPEREVAPPSDVRVPKPPRTGDPKKPDGKQ